MFPFLHMPIWLYCTMGCTDRLLSGDSLKGKKYFWGFASLPFCPDFLVSRLYGKAVLCSSEEGFENPRSFLNHLFKNCPLTYFPMNFLACCFGLVRM